MRKFAGPGMFPHAKTDLSAYLRSGNGRSEYRAAEPEQPQRRVPVPAVRDDSNMVGKLGAVGAAHRGVDRVDVPRDPRQRVQHALQRAYGLRPGTRHGDRGRVGGGYRQRDFGTGRGQPIERKPAADQNRMVRDQRAERLQLDDFMPVGDDLRLVENDYQVSTQMNGDGARDDIDAGAVADRGQNVTDDARLVGCNQRRRTAEYDCHDERAKRGDSDQSHDCRDAIRTSAVAPSAWLTKRSVGFGHLRRRRVDVSRTMLVPERRLEHAVVQPHRLRRDLDQLFLVDPFQRRVQRRNAWRRKPNRFIVARRAHVAEFFFTACVDGQVYLTGILADDHPFVNRLTGSDEEYPALLQMEDRVSRGSALAIGNHRPVGARTNRSRPRRVAVEQRIHQAVAAGAFEKSAAKPDQAARGDVVFQAHPVARMGDHRAHLALAPRERLRDHADVFRRDVDHEHLHRLEYLAAGLLGDDGGLRDLHLVAFAAHGLDNHRELQFAAAHHAPGLRRQLLDASAHIAPRFEFDSFAQLPRGDKISFAARPWRIVHRESHRHGRLVDANRRQRTRVLEVGDRFTDRDVLDARHDHYLARAGGFALDARESLPSVDMGDLADHSLAVAPAQRIVLRRRHRAGDDSADREAADVIVVVDIIDLELQRRVGIDFGAGQVRDDRVEQRNQVFAGNVEPERCGAGARLRIEHREIELAFVRAEVDEQIVNLVENLGCARVGAIDLVDADYRGQVRLERLLEHEPRLRQRPLARIDQQQHAVHHRQSALDLAAEIRVARSIDDVDARSTPQDRGVLGHDRDAAFALERVGIHHAIDHMLVGAENARLPQHRIDQSGFTVIDMSDDC